MPLTGAMFLGAERRTGREPVIASVDPRTDTVLEPGYGSAAPEDVARACELAEEAAPAYRATSPERRATFLERVADRVEALGEELTVRAMAESGLPSGRIRAERDRTTDQLRLLAAEVRDGGWVEARIDRALPYRTPRPRPDLRARQVGLGPVAVFGASNFPLAFSVAGGDTAAALAAGCPVVVKAHSADLGTSELVGSAVAAAVRESELPAGVFSLLFGSAVEIGRALVADPRIRAVGFTGSRAGGTALLRTAAARPVPIPVYAEMGSVNPVFLLPSALRDRAAALARGFVASLTTGAGQLRTKPGLLVAVEGPELTEFLTAAGEEVSAYTGETMLSRGVHDAYERAVAALAAVEGVRERAAGRPGEGANTCVARLFTAPAEVFLARPGLHDDVFGAAATVVVCRDPGRLVEVARALRGQLTATVHHGAGEARPGEPRTGEPRAGEARTGEGRTAEGRAGEGRAGEGRTGDLETVRALLPILETKAGRIVFDGWPTGVEVGHAMVHGGPFPAASDSRSTSVGTLAVRRFLRPVCYQDVPADLLPPALSDENPYGLRRRLDGTRDQI
ncbi:aldehyde dehydrogenase (NADP(+)) [Streptomyces sp. NPDC056909]|uniref:aldehyde dehydrogenase (NADP(+)) n=1 Tax=Streptomyces sp. NPDC056909 TaxID=3345963 RepID=UPI0036A46666